MTDRTQRRLASAKKAAKAAGAIIKNRFGTEFDVEYKSVKDPVTEVDRLCEETIKQILTSEHPEIEFWGEESGTRNPSATLSWVVDPLDGTKNFVHGYPFVAVSIALVENQVPIMGVVYDPIRDELFHAAKGQGTFVNDKAVTVSDTETIRDSLIVTSLSGYPPQQGALIVKACRLCQGVRRGGASALDLCQLAAGRIDAIWEWFLKPWDVAAGVIIIEEAQGTVTMPNGCAFDLMDGSLLASNTVLHKAFNDFINEEL